MSTQPIVNPKTKDPEKSADLPPYGPRNADPITDTPGSHPIETGIGAAIAGAASGMAIGAVGGPVGMIAGVIGGAIAGGYAGKGIGELIDPTTQDNWLREFHKGETDAGRAKRDDQPETYRSAYSYGVTSGGSSPDRAYDDVESDLRTGWASQGDTGMTWDRVRGYVKDGYERSRGACASGTCSTAKPKM